MATETLPTYAPIAGDNFFLLRSDGVKVHVKNKELREARDDGRAPAKKDKKEPSDDAGKAVAGPKKVAAPKIESDEKAAPKQTRAQAAAEYGMLIGIFFGGIGVATGTLDYVALSDAEQNEFGIAIAGVMPTLPTKIAKQISFASPWVRLGLTAANILAPRIIEYQRRAQAPVIAAAAAQGYAKAPIGEPIANENEIHPADRVFNTAYSNGQTSAV